jgi:hypothetical protein
LKDICIAREILEKEDLALVVVKEGEVIYKSKDKGIKPMYIMAVEMKDKGEGASIADKVVGKGAALLCKYIGIVNVYGKLISEGGIKVLEENKIPFISEKTCSYIKNKDKTDLCPIEKMAINLDNPNLFLERLADFFKSIK